RPDREWRQPRRRRLASCMDDRTLHHGQRAATRARRRSFQRARRTIDRVRLLGVVMRAWIFVLFVAACGGWPGAAVAVCPDPDPMTLTYDNFGHEFMTKYCTWCHSSELPRSQRNGAPIYHDYDTLLGVLQTVDHIDEQAGAGPKATKEFMPPDRCPST